MFRFSGFFRRYSTLSTAIHETYGDRKPTNLIVDYLSHSLRFSKKDAISISSKANLAHLKSTANSDLVVNTFKIYGLNNTQIKDIISYAPKSFDSTTSRVVSSQLIPSHFSAKSYCSLRELPVSCKRTGIPSVASAYKKYRPSLLMGAQLVPRLISRGVTTLDDSLKSDPQEASAVTEVPSRIKFKRLDKTARHIMQILDKEAVQEVRSQREIPDIRPGYIIQMRLETPENKRRVSTVKGIVIARRNAGLNSTIRIRRLVAGVGVESLLPLYSPNIKEIKVLDKKKVRRAKLYYLRDKMNALRK